MQVAFPDIAAVRALLAALPQHDREGLVRQALASTAVLPWVPNPGPQTDAYFCEADELLFGGAAGGGKSDFLIGLALTAHKHARILRRINKDVEDLGNRLIDILGSSSGYNGQKHIFNDGVRFVELVGCEQERDKQRFKGKARDLIAYDELADFLESQYVFINSWNRSTAKGQRCRIVGATNGPTDAGGRWIVKRWAAWLDPTHPRPAKSGELRWYLVEDGVEREVEGPGPYKLKGRPEPIRATSRTFIRSWLKDNPDLAATDYGSRLEGLPEELRRVYRDGDFNVGLKDGDFQVIPSLWIKAAQARWTPDGHRGHPMTAMGFDPAGGGADSAELCWRYGGWYAPLISAQGAETADGSLAAATIAKHMRHGAPVVIDVGGGYGGAVMMRCDDVGMTSVGFNGASSSTAKTRDGRLSFANKRSEAWWKFREELDPDQDGGSVIALPPDPILEQDLAAPTWKLTTRGIQVEPKVIVGTDGKITGGLRARLGRSPGKGDAVVMCLSEGEKAVARALAHKGANMQTSANLGHASLKRFGR